MVVSKRQVDRAGDVIRAHASGADLDRDAIAEAHDVAEEFRVGHALALDQSVADLQSASMELALPSETGRRLKRMETIQGKLVREPRLKLSRMRDIAGCRQTVATMNDLNDALEHLERNLSGSVEKVIDYVSQPRASGYRGIHVIGRYDGMQAELQLRTRLMHRWAQISEGVQSIETRESSTQAAGDVGEWLRRYGEALAFRDRGEILPKELENKVGNAPVAVMDALMSEGRQ